jgi:hypothetical protein
MFPHWLSSTGTLLQTWCANHCSSLILWALRCLLVGVLLTVVGLVLLCVHDKFVEKKSRWVSAKRIVGKTPLRKIPASFRNAGMGAKMNMRRKRERQGEGEGLDVGDSCTIM